MPTVRLGSSRTGIAQGDVEVFSEFDSGGSMWTGEGERERRLHLRFDDLIALLLISFGCIPCLSFVLLFDLGMVARDAIP